MPFIPSAEAHASSRLIVPGSKVSCCHISNWFDPVLGMKLHHTNQPFSAAHALTLALDHLDSVMKPVLESLEIFQSQELL